MESPSPTKNTVIKSLLTIQQLGLVAARADPVGICFRRCNLEGWGRPLAIRAEDGEEDGSKIEEDKFFGIPLGYGMGWQMMAPMAFPMHMMQPAAIGLPQSFGFFPSYSSPMWIPGL